MISVRWRPAASRTWLVIDGDPLADITRMRHITAVFKGGMSYDPAAILKEVPINPNCQA